MTPAGCMEIMQIQCGILNRNPVPRRVPFALP
jgi:hypothetical protein